MYIYIYVDLFAPLYRWNQVGIGIMGWLMTQQDKKDVMEIARQIKDATSYGLVTDFMFAPQSEPHSGEPHSGEGHHHPPMGVGADQNGIHPNGIHPSEIRYGRLCVWHHLTCRLYTLLPPSEQRRLADVYYRKWWILFRHSSYRNKFILFLLKLSWWFPQIEP